MDSLPNFFFFSCRYLSAGFMMISIFVRISISRSFWQLGQRIVNEALELNAPFLKMILVQWGQLPIFNWSWSIVGAGGFLGWYMATGLSEILDHWLVNKSFPSGVDYVPAGQRAITYHPLPTALSLSYSSTSFQRAFLSSPLSYPQFFDRLGYSY